LDNLNNKLKNKAIFLDRDWTINQDFSYVYKIEDLKLLEWAKEWLNELKNLWYKLIIITNQSWIWRWYYTMKDCNKFNEELETQLWLKFDWIYICPHSPDDNCECRKPKTLLVEKAIKDFNLDINQCYFVWDKESDIETGINVWCKTVVINGSNYKCNIEPDFCVNDLLEFAEMIK
jgi:D,D-heptose 1,7-bisphosphate phosphatase